MDKVKLIDLLYEVLPYVQEGEKIEAKERCAPLGYTYDAFQRWERRGRRVSARVRQAIETLEKWEAT